MKRPAGPHDGLLSRCCLCRGYFRPRTPSTSAICPDCDLRLALREVEPDPGIHIIQSDALALPIRSGTVQCCVTSPPYWGLRDYNVDGQLGLESTPDAYVGNMVAVFREVWRTLRDDGTLWLNLGDSYAANRSYQVPDNKWTDVGNSRGMKADSFGLKPKDLVGIPWRVAFALQADGWYLRSDIIWCLSGGAWVYAQTQKGEMPVMVRDLARLRAGTVRLWNGERWTSLMGMSSSPRRGDEIEIHLQSGERIGCTPTHRFPTQRGLVDASDLRMGDCLAVARLPEPAQPKDCAMDEDAAWLAGLYLAEGSRSGDTIQIAGHAKEVGRWDRLRRVAAKFGGSATITVRGRNQSVRLYGRVLNAMIDELVSGRTARDKAFAPVVWRYSNVFLRAMVTGYLEGDGHWDTRNQRWRLGFTRNDALARDLRTAAARLGATITLKPTRVKYKQEWRPTYRGEWRFDGEWNPRSKVVAIVRSRCREVYDLGVADEPHLFALASGVLTHNSKPNPMPESVTDRPTKAHEYLFLLTKSERYYYDAAAIAEPVSPDMAWRAERGYTRGGNGKVDATRNDANTLRGDDAKAILGGTRNRRSVWTIPTQPYSGAHFATFPERLVEPCLRAASRVGDLILDPFAGSGTVGRVAHRLNRRAVLCELSTEYLPLIRARIQLPTPR